MNPEEDRVEESAASYVTKKVVTKPEAATKPAAEGTKLAGEEDFKKAMAEVFETHSELFKKLAQ